MTCAGANCPIQVGLLIFVGAEKNGHIPSRQCTAFLVASDLVMSNAHCDWAEAKGYFVSQKINGSTQVREIVDVPYKLLTVADRPDAAQFRLREPIKIEGLELAKGSRESFSRLIAYSVKAGTSDRDFSILEITCDVHRHESLFPYNISENPDMIAAFGCAFQKGMSGSPLFAPGSDKVQAIAVGKMGEDALLAANVRCLNLPGTTPAECVEVTPLESSKRAEQSQIQVLTKERPRTGSEGRSIIFGETKFQLHPVEGMRFEVIRWPKCRRSPESLKSVPFIIEQIEAELDARGSMQVKSLSEVRVEAEVLTVFDDVYEVQIEWPSPAGPYLQPELDLRTKWGSRFDIEFPVCPR